MKKNFAIFSLIAIIIITGLLLAQKKDTTPLALRWTKVEKLAEQQLPESALKEVDEILAQAIEDNNTTQIIIATIYKMRFTLEIDPDKAPALIREFETMAQNEKALDKKAILLSMTAEMYVSYYQNNAWTIDQRTKVVGTIPEDIKEWTKNIFYDKIEKLLSLSLQNKSVLQQTDVLKYEALLDKGDDSRTFQPTLFDFLAYRYINLLQQISQACDLKNPVLSDVYYANATDFVKFVQDSTYASTVESKTMAIYQQLIEFHTTSNYKHALVYSDLNRLQYIKNIRQVNELYIKALEELEQKYASNELLVEVLNYKAQFYLNPITFSNNKTDKRTAYDICNRGIKQFPTSKRIGLLKNIKNQIAQKSLSVNHIDLIKPASNLSVKINTANITVLEMNIYKINATAVEYNIYNRNKQIRNEDYPNRTLLETKTIKLKTNPNFLPTDTTINVLTNEYGIYEITVHSKYNLSKEEISKTSFIVSDLGCIFRTNEANKQSVYVLNRQSGLQQKSVQVAAYQQKWTGNGYNIALKYKIITDVNGNCKIPFADNYSENILFFEFGADKYFSTTTHSYLNDNMSHINSNSQLNLFTDRSIYRPGQTVYFKGIAYFANKNRNEVEKSVSYEVSLYDANRQKVSSKSYKTNEFGSFAGEFILPEGGLNGAYRIQSGNYSQTFYVEEYKRPTFEVIIDKPKSEIKFGSKITLSGNVKAYAGYNIGNANIKYRVTRTSHRYCWWWNEPETEISNGNTTSDSNGKFEVSFIAEKPKSSIETGRGSFYTYTISADVTDPKGETQQGEQYVSVGDKSLFILATVPEKTEKSTGIKLDIATETLNGEKLESVINYEIFRLEELSDYVENKNDISKTKNAEKIVSGIFNTKDKTLNLEVKKWKSAQYRIIFKTNDAFGNEVKTDHVFIVYDNADKRPPIKTYTWLLTPKTECVEGEKARIRFGTSSKNTAVLYEIMQGNKIIESKWMKFNDEIRDFEILFKKEYGAGVTVFFTFMKDENLFTEQIQIIRKVAEKKLTPTLSVFRNKLQPGEKAEWTITIPETAKDKNAAELLVGMYDASLDAIRAHSWSFNPLFRESILYSPTWTIYNKHNSSDYVYYKNDQLEVYDFKLDNLNWFGLNISSGSYRRGHIPGVQVMNAEVVGAVSAPVEMDEVVTVGYGTQKRSSLMGAISSDKAIELPTPEKQKPVQIRTNFNETAFFYPQLRTDAQGNVKFSFTAPESLTRWNVKMLAHTSDLFVGLNEAQVVTQKELMVQMNLPRFVRRSDKLVLSATIINLTDKELTTNVNFELIDPATDKNIDLKDYQSKKITLKANETKAINWEITEFMPYELVICKVIATAGNFSDGEQKYLPVLPDKVLITESLPLIIRSNQTRKFTFESLLKNATKVDTKNLVVEFSSNPAWYAIQALPTLSTPENNNALDYLTAYYANTLAAFIANSNPKIAKVFDQWKNATSSRDALLSNLQKNAELKNMLLEETPWVMAAKDETEQKRQIALLFDLNMQKNQGQQYLDKLLQLQGPNGGFVWFEGMHESRYITQEILLNLARLNKMTKSNLLTTYHLPLTAALTYLDLEIARDFAELKKYNKNYLKENCIGNMQLFYLHLRSEYSDIPVHVSAQEAIKFYTAQSEKYWTSFTLYCKAMMAIVAYRNGKIKTANLILKSLKENALKTDEMGMYWARNTSGYFWNERPIAVQAAIIEAYTEVSNNTADIDEMKIWLLKQKQTQRWDSPTATVNAIYALLLQGSDWLANNGSVRIQIGTKTLQPSNIEAGTGYFKETIPTAEVKSEMGNIKVSNIVNEADSRVTNGIGWGAMYWQYYQNQEMVQAKGGALSISKKLFVKTPTSTIIPIEQTQLKKGDKVITRLVITTDRNLEFVALKDLRAACFEPVEQRSGYIWREGTGYYQTTKDASTQFFFNYLSKGTYVFEYELWVNNSGSFTSGIASVQCQYAPEFISHTGGERIVIK
jgi:hypothetical protein